MSTKKETVGAFTMPDPEKRIKTVKSEGPTLAAIKEASIKLEPQIADLLSRYMEPRAALLPVLHLYQKEFGWLSSFVQREIAFRLKIAPADVHRVVSFYSLFRATPCGKNVIMVCGTLSCELGGCNKVIAALRDELGIDLNEMTSDGLFSIERVECLGWCDKAPVVQVNESDFHENVTAASVKELVRSLRK